MDQVSASDTANDVVRSRRKRLRAEARGLPATEPDGFQTPQWLDHSFVLPLTAPEVSDVPSQSVPHHDDFESRSDGSADPASAAGPAFVRPPTKSIDFARVIRRADLSRAATRTALASTSVAGLLLLLAYLLSLSAVVLGMAISFGLVALVATAVRVRLATAPIPHLDT